MEVVPTKKSYLLNSHSGKSKFFHYLCSHEPDCKEMKHLLKSDSRYIEWVNELALRYRAAQIKAATKVNEEMLQFYWYLGKEINKILEENKYGSGFYSQLSTDLKRLLPNAKGFSSRNLRYINNFYSTYSNLQQVVADFEQQIFGLPWGHHVVLLNKFANQPEISLFYIRKCVKEGWSRNTLLNIIDTQLHLREGKAVTNFKSTLSPLNSDLAQEITKDPYIFDFTSLREPFIERELKDALLNNISKFLLELGNGFAYVGREYKLEVGQTEKFTDLLFYHLKLRCYVVIEVKTEKFDPSHLGQLGFYVTAVNHILKTEHDNPTIGLLVCKTKDNVVAQYSLEGYNLPIGISEYDLSKALLDDFKSSLPTIEEIEAELMSTPIPTKV